MNLSLRMSASALVLVASALLTSCGTCSQQPGALGDKAAVTQRIAELLRRYALNDREGVLAMLDPVHFSLYGSDVAELVHTPAQLSQLMTDDFALWHSASFGSVQDLDLRVDGTLATAFFHVPFSVAGRLPILVRFSTTWRKQGNAWFLTQSSNTVPTTGSSAAELAQHK